MDVYKICYGKPDQHTPLSCKARFSKISKSLRDIKDQKQKVWAENICFQESCRGIIVDLPPVEGEAIYGLGLQMKSFIQNGTKKTLRPNADAPADSGDSVAPVPFFVSTAGYGVYVDTARHTSFYCKCSIKKDANPENNEKNEVFDTPEALYKNDSAKGRMLIDIPFTQGIDIYLFFADSMRDVICGYNMFSGGGVLPPLWGLGVQYRTYAQHTQQEVINLAKQLREDKMPCDVIGLEPGWQTHSYSCSYIWDKGRFPVSQDMLDQLSLLGFRVNLWEQAFVNPQAKFYDAISPSSGNYVVWNGLVPDFSLLSARDIFINAHKAFIEQGIAAFKLDECDGSDFTGGWSFPDFAEFPSGLNGEQMHSLFGVLFQQVHARLYQDQNMRTYGLVRNSHALASDLPFVLYSDLYAHEDFIRGMANSAFCGLLWTPEVRQTHSADELIRRLQSVVISPYALVNSWMLRHPPWRQFDREKNLAGEYLSGQTGDELLDICRKLLSFRMQLIPYIYTAFYFYQSTGLPPIRPIVVDYPEDAHARVLFGEFMIGNDILAAPIPVGEDGPHRVYLPEGKWCDFYTGKKYRGKQFIERSYALDEIPLFARYNSIIPLADTEQNVMDVVCFSIRLHQYGDRNAKTILYEDDGRTLEHQKGMFNMIEIISDGSKVRIKRSGMYCGQPKYRFKELAVFKDENVVAYVDIS